MNTDTDGSTPAVAATQPVTHCNTQPQPAFIGDVLLKKYQLHLPLYRQSQSLWRAAQVDVSRSTLCAAGMAAGALLVPVNAAQREELLARAYLPAAAPPWAYKAPRHRKVRTTAPGNGNTARPEGRSSLIFK